MVAWRAESATHVSTPALAPKPSHVPERKKKVARVLARRSVASETSSPVLGFQGKKISKKDSAPRYITVFSNI